MSAPQHPRYAFGPFELDPGERQLRRSGEPVYVLPKVFDVLLLLIVRAGHLVTKEEILAEVWQDVEVQESSLTASISRLRALLDDHGRQGGYIETVTGHGYRFVAPVRVTAAAPAAPRAGRRRLRLLGVTGVLGVVAAASLLALEAGSGKQEDGVESAVSAYRRGAALLATRREGARAMELFHEAVRIDPGYAPAYAGMAQIYAMDHAAAELTEAAALRAIELDPRLADAWAALGFSRAMHRWDWGGSEAAFRRALSLDPNDTVALQWLATVRMIQRRFHEADQLLVSALAQEVRPGLYADRCQLLYYRRDLMAASAECDKALQLDPVFPFATYWRFRIALNRRDAAQAAAAAGMGSVENMEGLLDSLLAWSDRVAGLNGRYEMAQWHVLAGRSDLALESLDRAIEERAYWAPFANADPIFDPLRGDRRFRRAMERMGL